MTDTTEIRKTLAEFDEADAVALPVLYRVSPQFIANVRALVDTVDALRVENAKLTDANLSVAVCANHVREVTGQGCLVCESEALSAEVTRLRSALEKAEKWILQKREYRDRDHACTECVPGGSIVIPGFQCAFHAALAQARE